MAIQASDLIIKTFTKDEFTHYVEEVVAPKLVWRPQGVVLHNTGSPTLAQFNRGPHGPISDQQRILNSVPDWQKRGFSGAPHLYILPGRIVSANPLWKKGTHSPSWNSTFWGIEMAGDFDREAFPPETKDYALHALACLYAALGKEPSNSSFHFHKEDPATTHKGCPGKNVGTKVQWIADIHSRMSFLHPGGHSDEPVFEDNKKTGEVFGVAADDFLFMRSAAGAANKAIGKLVLGEKVAILADPNTGWIQVKAKDITGWVAERYIKDA